MQITVENIKCSGCTSTIHKKLSAIFHTDNIQIDIERGTVSLDIDATQKPALVQALLKMGYPETNSVHGLRSATAKTKSFVSCAIGKMNK